MRQAVASSVRFVAVASLAVIASCRGSEPAAGRGSRPTDVRAAAAAPARFDLGATADSAEIAAWNIDANSAGEGLPAGSGNYADGARLYAQQCGACHGQNGEGGGAGAVLFPKLVSKEPAGEFAFGRDPKIVKTIGNYWPHATTLYDYINRAMPITAPGSLTAPEVYSIVAYLLVENRVVPKSTVIDAVSLPKITMPARDKFVPDDRQGGPVFR